jgi:sulfate-transporting ATPase
MKAVTSLLDRFDEISNRLGEVTDDDEMNKLLEEQGTLQDKIDARRWWNLDATSRWPWVRCAAPPGTGRHALRW